MTTENLDPSRLLTAHRVEQVTDLQSLHGYVAGKAGGQSVRRRMPTGPPIEVDFRHVELGDADIGLLWLSSTMIAEAALQAGNRYLFQLPLSGRIELELDGQPTSVGPGVGVVISPRTRVRRESGPGWVLAFAFDYALVRSRLALWLGRPSEGDLVFTPLVTGAAAELRDYSLLLVEAIDRGVATRGRSLMSTLLAGLVDLLLEIQPHNQRKAIAGAERTAPMARVQTVTEYLLAHLDEPLKIEDLAREAGCSVRALQLTFAEQCGVSPLEFVRRRRLLHARELLETGDPDVTVTDVALRTGFTHVSRFSASYRRLFGEAPSETVRRAAAQAKQRAG